MPVVIVEMLETGDTEQKKQLVKDLTAAFVKIGVPSGSVNIILRENPKSCWAIDGQICSDFEIPPGA
jgi:4-oxalocrotonate tautomerase family enzyme